MAATQIQARVRGHQSRSDDANKKSEEVRKACKNDNMPESPADIGFGYGGIDIAGAESEYSGNEELRNRGVSDGEAEGDVAKDCQSDVAELNYFVGRYVSDKKEKRADLGESGTLLSEIIDSENNSVVEESTSKQDREQGQELIADIQRRIAERMENGSSIRQKAAAVHIQRVARGRLSRQISAQLKQAEGHRTKVAIQSKVQDVEKAAEVIRKLYDSARALEIARNSPRKNPRSPRSKRYKSMNNAELLLKALPSLKELVHAAGGDNPGALTAQTVLCGLLRGKI
jgi:hypothetical protein